VTTTLLAERGGRARALLTSPLSTYHILLGATGLLLALGLVMVLSASSVESYKVFGSSFVLAQRQLMFAIIGVVLMLVTSRLPVRTIRGLAWPSLGLALVLLLLVLVIGVSVAGQRNWISLGGPFRLQPSEFAKLALVIWGADLLARKQALVTDRRHLLVPLLPVSALIIGLVLLGRDLGTVLILLPIVAGLLFAAGAGWGVFATLGAAAVAGVAALSMGTSYRMGRFEAWLNPDADPLGVGWQLTHAHYALALGGWWGEGLGASREKWGSLPEAHTDFIFAVVGEELGLFGTLVVMGCVMTLMWGGSRIALTAKDEFGRLVAVGVTAWLGFQALIHIGVTVGTLPTKGITLPFVSYGGSSLVVSLVGVGLLLAVARDR